MIEMIELNGDFCTSEVYQIYCDCMYQPTWEKFCRKAEKYLADSNVRLLSAVENSTVLGIIVLQKQTDERTEIIGIAVSQHCRRCGIGRKMVAAAMTLSHTKQLYAETDADAVTFYQGCGFQTESHVETFPDGEVVRYQCVLNT